jgi:hypothetical protein
MKRAGTFNGVDWLLKNHRELVDAEFALNPDSGGITMLKGKALNIGVEAAEKLYAGWSARRFRSN